MSGRESVVARRYASALLRTAPDAPAAEALAAALDGLAEATRDPTYRRMATEARTSPAERLGVLVALAQALGAPERVERFLGVLGRGRRLGAIPAIAARFRTLMEERFGGRRATVRLAFGPSPALLEALRVGLEARLGTKLELLVEVDPSLLGGFEVRCGDRLIRADLGTRLEALAASLVDALDGGPANPSR